MADLSREQVIVSEMIGLYCRRKHRSVELCDQCRQLNKYAQERLAKCPYQEKKPSCRRCTIHCYRPEMRSRIRAVMRFAGPRMLIFRPGAFLRHIFR